MRTAVVGLVLTLAAVGPLLATSCKFPPPCQRLRPDVVFLVGEFTGESGVPAEQRDGAPTFKHRVLVREHLFGLSPQTSAVTVLASTNIEAGGLHLFELLRQGDFFQLHDCAAFGPIDSRYVTPLLHFLREARSGGAGKIRASVWDLDYKNSHSIEGAAVLIEGPVRREAPTVNGGAEFLDLPPGEYRVSARREGYEPDPAHPAGEVVVYPRGCPDSRVALRSGLKLSGIVTSHTGQPAGGVKLWLWEDRPQPSSAMLYRGTTEADGTFRFSRVKPGRYHILTAGAEAKSYFPGRATRAEATPIEVNANQRLENLRLMLRDPGAPRTVRFRVLNAQGEPVAGAVVMDLNFDDRFEPGGYSSIGDPVRTGSDGSVAVRLWENAHYRVDASLGRFSADVMIAPRQDAPPGKGDTEVTLVLQPVRYRPGRK